VDEKLVLLFGFDLDVFELMLPFFACVGLETFVDRVREHSF